MFDKGQKQSSTLSCDNSYSSVLCLIYNEVLTFDMHVRVPSHPHIYSKGQEYAPWQYEAKCRFN